MTTGLYAFWRYADFPFLLGGTVVETRGGKVKTKEFGPGHWFSPVFVLPVERGIALRQAMEGLDKRRTEAHRDVDRRYLKKLKVLTEGLEAKTVAKAEGRTQLVGYAIAHRLVPSITEARRMDLDALRRTVGLHRLTARQLDTTATNAEKE